MLKEAIQHIQNTAEPYIEELDNGHFLIVFSNGNVKEFTPSIDRPQEIGLDSLDALVKMVKFEALPYLNGTSPLYIMVPKPTKVICFASPDRNDACFRQYFYTASATDIPGFTDGYRDHESAIIQLRSKFVPNEGTEYLLDLLSRISEDSSVTSTDNGVSQVVEVRKGVSLLNKVTVKPRVLLRPYRTFHEVEQPESEFLLRVGEGAKVGLFEADGGMWKLQARNTVKAFLEESLADEVENQSVIVAL